METRDKKRAQCSRPSLFCKNEVVFGRHGKYAKIDVLIERNINSTHHEKLTN